MHACTKNLFQICTYLLSHYISASVATSMDHKLVEGLMYITVCASVASGMYWIINCKIVYRD